MLCQKKSKTGEALSNRACVVGQPDERLAGQQIVPVVQADPQAVDRRHEREASGTAPGTAAGTGTGSGRARAASERSACCRGLVGGRGRRDPGLLDHRWSAAVLLAVLLEDLVGLGGRVGERLGGLLAQQDRLVDRDVDGRPWRRAMPGTDGGKCRSSIWLPIAACSLSAANSALSRIALRAGTWPPLAHSSDCWLMQLMNTLPAWQLVLVGGLLLELHEVVRAGPGGLLGADLRQRADAPLEVLHVVERVDVQMPFQLNAVLPFCKAITSASWATFFGL